MTLIMLGMHGSRVSVLIILAVILSTAEEYMRSIDCLKEISGIVEKLCYYYCLDNLKYLNTRLD